MQQAQRYPKNHDCIVALEPVLDYDEVIQKGLQAQQQVLGTEFAMSPAGSALPQCP